MNPSTNFAGSSKAKRFAHNGMWLFATRASRMSVPPIAMSIYILSNTAKLVRGLFSVVAIHPLRQAQGVLANGKKRTSPAVSYGAPQRALLLRQWEWVVARRSVLLNEDFNVVYPPDSERPAVSCMKHGLTFENLFGFLHVIPN
jgi:hypothetical protein